MKLAALTACTLLLSITHASADWQFTRWGLTPAEVMRASKGAATPLSSSESARSSAGSEIAELTMPFASGDLRFDATFLFEGEKLSRVVLHLADESKLAQLSGALERKYGPAIQDGDVSKWYAGRDEIMLALTFGELEYVSRSSRDGAGL